jgi:hypothetical protein
VQASTPSPAPADAVVEIEAGAGPVNTFDPTRAFGGAVDGLSAGRVSRLYTDHNEGAILSAGLRPLSYSLRTELAIEAWHWGEEGSWSDPEHRQGYWTTSDNPRRPVLNGWGYFLPRRGDSTDQANDNGYSRIDDGDPASFWKSNPYLDGAYTHRPERPQWVIVSFKAPRPISAARIRWAAPYARAYTVQYWVGDNPNADDGRWVTFRHGVIADGKGGEVVQRLADTPVQAQYIRFLLTASSRTAPPGSTDRRDAMGYAMAELGLGEIGPDGTFVDLMRHARSGSAQTNIYVSSTDPWHRAGDRDPNVQQPGFDRVFASGLTRGLPVMISVGPLYDTPENAAAEIRFLKRRGYLAREIEVGEEPDGQNVTAEDFADLYLEFADAVHGVDPSLKLGGPSLQDAVTDTWLDDAPDHNWTRRLVASLRARGRMADLSFFSFEHYPFDSLCGRLDQKLLQEDGMLADDVARLHRAGVPANIPWVISEYGFSAFSGQGEVELPGALFDADMVAHFLSLGGRGAYLLGYGPDELFEPDPRCAGWGELMLFGEDGAGRADWPTPAYWAAAMLARDWARPGDGPYRLYRAQVRSTQARSANWVVAYPAQAPDGTWSTLLVNRDPGRAHRIRLQTRGGSGAAALPGPFDVVQYGPQQYSWRSAGSHGHPLRDAPPRRFSLAAGAIDLQPYSLTVVRARGAGA